jgi:hypothetical protein
MQQVFVSFLIRSFDHGNLLIVGVRCGLDFDSNYDYQQTDSFDKTNLQMFFLSTSIDLPTDIVSPDVNLAAHSTDNV